MYVNAGKVYVFQNRGGVVKVGCSKDVERRKRTLETQSGSNATKFYHTENCSNYHKVESAAHKILKEFRVVGEWFNCDFEIAVKAVDAAFNEKAKFDFETEEDVAYRIKEFAEYWSKAFLPAFWDEDKDPRDKLDLDKWVPSKKDEPMVLQFLREWYEGTLETADEEAAQEYLDLYNRAKEKGIVACKDEIQGTICEIFWAVDGEIEEYYAGDKSLLEIMNLTILKEPVSA